MPDIVVSAGVAGEPPTQNAASLERLFWSGLKAGALTFGGAYTVIPFLQEDAVVNGAWLSNAQFLDGVALAGLLPAPLIIFATFVGYLGGGAAGALILTIGIFLPAFALTLLGHRPLERFVHQPLIRPFLDGVTAAVVGLIGGTALALLPVTVVDPPTAVVFVLALITAFVSRSKFVVPVIVAAAIAAGLALTALGTYGAAT
jgi:chromate transporter